MAKKTTLAGQLGKALAHIQDTIDLAVTWGFMKLRRAKIEESEEESPKNTAKRIANGVFAFFGELGETFYKEYEKIKQDRINKK